MTDRPAFETHDPHQADHVLRAFRYQLLQSIASWLDLNDGEEIWLEVLEDFSVVSASSSNNVQVKFSDAASGPTALSLRSPGVKSAILRFWEAASARGTKLTFIARGGAARERGSGLPEKQSGIRFWTSLVNTGDTAPLRKLLVQIFKGTALAEWLNRGPSDSELRERLLVRVRFAVDSKDDSALERIIHDRLASMYLAKGHLASAADVGLSLLISQVFSVASRPEAGKRRLNSNDLHVTLEQAIPRLGAGDQLALLTGTARAGSAPVAAVAVEKLRLRPRSILRPLLVADLRRRIVSTSVAWLKGSSGVGKSTLAALLAHAHGGSWLVCDFRLFAKDGEERGSVAVWHELMRVLNQEQSAVGVILDDVSIRTAELLKVRIAGLSEMITARGGQVLITSTQSPSGALLSELGVVSPALIDAPYFTIDEIRELVEQAPAPEAELIDAWARIVHLATQQGHPLLTIAKITNLRERMWPRSALTEDIGTNAGDGIRSARADARLRLLDELTTTQERELLARTSAVFQSFDDALVLKLGHAEPAISNPGDALALLRGSWIEPMADGQLRLSPLIADLQREVPEAQARKWRQLAAEHWMSGGHLNERTLPLAFWNGFLGKHHWVLLKLATVILTLPANQLRSTVALLSPMTVLRTDASLWSDIPALAVALRLVQLRVADAVEDQAVAVGAANAWLRELDSITPDLLQSVTVLTAPINFVDLQYVRLPTELQISFLLRVEAAWTLATTSTYQELQDAVARFQVMLPKDTDVPGFVMTQILMRIKDSAEFEELINRLATVDATIRRRWLDSASRLLDGPGIWIHGPWANEQLGGKDLAPTLERYERMSRVVASWNDLSLDAEFAVALSAILDEGLDKPEAALAATGEAISRVGRNPSLLRQEYKVLLRRREFSRAATAFLEARPELQRLFPFDRALSLRDGAIACANAGSLDEAFTAFEDARTLLVELGSRDDLQVGLTLEMSLIRWVQQNQGEALRLLVAAFQMLDRIDSSATRQGRRARRAASAMAVRFSVSMRPLLTSSKDKLADLVFGVASQVELSGKPVDESSELPSLESGWMILRQIEAELGDAGVVERAKTVTAVRTELDDGVEALLGQARFTQALQRASIYDAVSAIEPMVTGFLAIASRKDLDVAQLRRDAIMGAFVDVVLCFALMGRWTKERSRELAAAVAQILPLEPDLLNLLEATQSRNITGVTVLHTYCSLVPLILNDEDLDLRSRFARDLHLTQATVMSCARSIIWPLVSARIVQGWRGVLARQRFLLISPVTNVPVMDAALSAFQESGLGAADALFLALSSGTGVGYAQQWRVYFQGLQRRAAD